MNDWSQVFLGTIAVATLVMAVIQVGAVVAGARLLRRVERLVEEVGRDVRPLVARATEVAEEAKHAAAFATAQAERLDRLVADVTQRVTDTLDVIQGAIVRPVQEGVALVTGLRAGLAALRGLRNAGRESRVDDEDALFIG